MTATRPDVSIPFDQAFAIAHAMNNLLAIIAGRLDDIHEAAPDPTQAREAAALGLLATERAARLMRGMMASLNGEIFRAGRCDSGQVLRGIQAMRRAPGLTPIALDGPGEGPALLCDPVALSDLIGNVLDALTPRPGEPIRLRCAMLEGPCGDLPGGSFAELRITGGLPCAEPDWRERALGESWRSALQRFCRAAGGDALLEGGPPGQPMVIRLCLPGYPMPSPAPPEAPAPTPVRVLVVEDDEPVRQHAERVISGLGYDIIAVPSAEAALSVVDGGGQVDILFTDVILPGGMSGGELAEHVQRIRPSIPIVFTSGHNADHRVSRIMLSRGATLLPKPYRRGSLAAALAAAAMAARAGTREQRPWGD
ncbi:response regulator [Roseococcus sp. SDR]|uniref:response regulator n=1 Tax=Roseococcus sp. SDR TaxID=2835532 RepID=UPI001BCBA642|nr:response regulator [Roseococcus sp. SDR]MBS7789732.1 response regulator [Roseococcus sp. SDR]MBV1845046.1 response regulator [Roseococcus sp. SDR]